MNPAPPVTTYVAIPKNPPLQMFHMGRQTVSRILCLDPETKRRSFVWAPAFAGARAAYPETWTGRPRRRKQRHVSLFGLAPCGVCQADPSPDRWCALTAPFHPYPGRGKEG